MASQTTPDLCPNDRVNTLVAAAAGNDATGMRALDDALSAYPRDPRLHFLRGSLLAGRQDYAGARAAIRRAVDLAPDYAIARFQLGFLLLTSGEPYAAQEAWGPLHALPPEHYLRAFVVGLNHLIADRFDEAASALRVGIGQNRENPAMNRDMQLIIDAIRGKPSPKPSGGPSTAVDLLLQQAALKASKH